MDVPLRQILQHDTGQECGRWEIQAAHIMRSLAVMGKQTGKQCYTMFRCTSIELNVNFWQTEAVWSPFYFPLWVHLINWQGPTTSSIVLLVYSVVPRVSRTHCPVVTKTQNSVGAHIEPAAQFPKLHINKPMPTASDKRLQTSGCSSDWSPKHSAVNSKWGCFSNRRGFCLPGQKF